MYKLFTKNGNLSRAVKEVLSEFDCDRIRVYPLNDGGAEIELSFLLAEYLNGREGRCDVCLDVYENLPEAFALAVIKDYEAFINGECRPAVYIVGETDEGETSEDWAEYIADLKEEAVDTLLSVAEAVSERLCPYDVCECYDRHEKAAGREGLYEFLTIVPRAGK